MDNLKQKIVEIIDEGRRFGRHPSKDADQILEVVEEDKNIIKLKVRKDSPFKTSAEQEVLDKIRKIDNPTCYEFCGGYDSLIKSWQNKLNEKP